MQASAARDGAVALRTDHGFVLSYPHEGCCSVDDFAVDADELWATDGRDLLLAAWYAARSPEQSTLRAVTARNDTPKREMLAALGMVVTCRWWVKELKPSATASTWGPVKVSGVDALIMPAPPVYDPGGPVCLLGDIDGSLAAPASDAAAAHGAVLAIVTRDRASSEAPSTEPKLEAVNFHNPSEFYEGTPA